VIFLHHSTGNGVFDEGNVAAWFDNYNATNSTNYIVDERDYPYTPYTWDNYPYDYWNLWINGVCDNSDPDIECLSGLCANYDVIIFKHCFPGAFIYPDEDTPDISSSKRTIANYQLQYRALRDLMDTYPNNKFIVWTLAPQHRLATGPEYAARARQFVDWVKNEWLTEDGKAHPNIYIFDFFGYVAELDPDPANGQVNCLKYDFERDHTENDSHPNTAANEYVGPIFAEFIVSAIKDVLQVNVTGITITGANGANTIKTAGGTLQLSANITPANATNKAVTWSIQNGTGQASINSSGLVTAIKDGTATAKATAKDGSGVSGNLVITISGQTVAVTGITVAGANGQTTITTAGGTLQLIATVTPNNATKKEVNWTIQNGTGQASISSSGIVTAIADGTVTAKATAKDGSGIYGTLVITVATVPVAITNIILYGEGFKTSINTPGGTLQLHTNILPVNATDKSVTWSVQNGTGQASIDENGLLTAIANGTVTVKATANDGSGTSGILIITIENQNILTEISDNDSASPFVSVNESKIIIHLTEGKEYNNLSIYNMPGNLILIRKITDPESTISVSDLPPGIYIIAISGINNKTTLKAVVH